MDLTLKNRILKASYHPTAFASELEDHLGALYGFSHRYLTARLCIGLSLAHHSPVESLPIKQPMGTAIKGDTLFGEDDVDIWISLIVIDGNLSSKSTEHEFRQTVEAHWNRGATLLRNLIDETKGPAKLLSALSTYLPQLDDSSTSSVTGFSAREVVLKIGEISRLLSGSKEISFALNGPGTSPVIALMGKMGSGKTRTALDMAIQISQQTHIPALIIDPKGDFAPSGSYGKTVGESFPGIKCIIVGENPIPIDFLPTADNAAITIQNVATRFRDSIALACTGAGSVQKDLLRQAVAKVIADGTDRSLNIIKSYYEQELLANNKKADSIVSRLNELTSMNCFSPRYNLREFFTQSWVISLNHIQSEEVKMLLILLLLDAFSSYAMSQSDANIDLKGNRDLRNLLFIEEARRILSQRRYESLADIVRQGRSKGLVTMLVSQDPSDFYGQADDFISQLGTIISFACNQSSRGLAALQGAYGRKLQPNEFTDTYLTRGVALAKTPGENAERILCWE